jgi:hypothetical protein
MAPADRLFVISTWSRSYRTSDYAGLIAMSRYSDIMHREIEAIIDHPTTRTLVAEEPGEVDHEGRPFLYGFIAARPGEMTRIGEYRLPCVYFVYVKTKFRCGRQRLGLPRGYGAELLAAAAIDPRKPFVYACRTDVVGELARKIPLAEFNPLPARFLT